MSDNFRIDLEIFCDRYKVNESLQRDIGLFVIDSGKGQSIENLYRNFWERHAQQDALADLLPNKKESLSATANVDRTTVLEMIRQMMTLPDIVNNGRKILRYSFPYFDGRNNLGGGALINLPFALTYSDLRHQKMFRTIFANMLSQTDFPDDFLNFHLSDSFNGNFREYQLFLSLIDKDFGDTLNIHNYIITWVKVRLTYSAPQSTSTDQRTLSDKETMTVRQYAIMHHYLQEAGIEILFEKSTETKTKQIEVLVEKYGGISFKNFQTAYNRIHGNKTERLKHIADLEAVIARLPESSKARQIVLDEIKIAKQRSPLT